ncbi:MAG: cupredoxin domain-containing protein [Thaumarchaeota archaeon]|nr:cupredoxin domain-containing protein [Nitrososphaerota archaeon]
MCIVHPFMTASFELGDVTEQPEAKLTEDATVSEPSSVIPEPTPSETPAEVPAETAPITPQEPAEEPVEAPPTEEQLAETIVSIPAGSSVPGCEATNECFIPSSITIVTGNTVTWTNDDTAAHTVTSGMDATPDGTFDSSLLPAGKTFSFKFESSGEYPYYCMVHPWMTGKVTVE